MTLRSSPFLVFAEDSGRCRVFNTATKKAYDFAADWDDLVESANSDDDLGSRLGAHGLLTTCDTYLDAVEELLQQRKLRSSRVLNVTFTVTTRCEMGCVYCFQGHMTRRHTKADTIDVFHARLRDTLKDNPEIQTVYLLIMGGEPMLCPELVVRLVTGTVEICTRAGVHCTMVMTTNGCDVSWEVVDQLGGCGLEEAQITFDGNRVVHDGFRPNSYARIMANLPRLTAAFSVAVKYNVGKRSCRSEVFSDFLEDLTELNLDPERYLVEFEPLQKSLAREEDSKLFFDRTDPTLARRILDMARGSLAKGVPASVGPALRAPCVGTTDNSIMIEPNGDIQSCVTSYGFRPFRLGNVGEVRTLQFAKDEVRASILEGARTLCSRTLCPFFPMCETGCILDKRMAGKKAGAPLCRRSYFDGFFPDLIHWMLERNPRETLGDKPA